MVSESETPVARTIVRLYNYINFTAGCTLLLEEGGNRLKMENVDRKHFDFSPLKQMCIFPRSAEMDIIDVGVNAKHISIDTSKTYKAITNDLVRYLDSDSERTQFAQCFCYEIIKCLWNSYCQTINSLKPLRNLNLNVYSSSEALKDMARKIASDLSTSDLYISSYVVGSIYTALLPSSYRSKYGSYYTPPFLVKRLLDELGKAGFNWGAGSVMDPACGGGAFLMPVVSKMLENATGTPETIIKGICSRIRGQEIDAFAGWVSQVFLDIILLPLSEQCNTEVPVVVDIVDSLNQPVQSKYDLVVGNPPYGKLRLDDDMRDKYRRSLFGHANNYGLFTDLAIQLTKKKGFIGYVTPTSFLSGQYFKALRSLLYREAPLYSIDFVTDREGIFDDVLQETALSIFMKGSNTRSVSVNSVSPSDSLNENAKITHLGRYSISETGPWLMPRDLGQVEYLKKCNHMNTRLIDLGYKVSTGQLVWNRHKSQLKEVFDDGGRNFPIIWAESISRDRFKFSYSKKNHKPFIELQNDQEYLLTLKECVLVQRTTSKEQDRRLIAAVIPQDFISKYSGVVVENHINMLYCVDDKRIEPATICTLLNSKTLDMLLRCISGSVAVSAYELNSLPLPNLKSLLLFQEFIKQDITSDDIELEIMKMYEVDLSDQLSKNIAS